MIAEILEKLNTWLNKYKIETIFITGELPFYILNNQTENTKIIKIVSAFQNQADILSKLIASECLNKPIKKTNDSNYVEINDIKIYFITSNYKYLKNEEVRNYLSFRKIDTFLEKCLVEQSVTTNSLLLLPHTYEIKDITDSKKDIESKNIRTILPPEIGLKYSNKIFFDCLETAVKYNFDLSKDIIKSYRINEIYNRVSKDLFNSNIKKYIKINEERTLNILKELDYE